MSAIEQLRSILQTTPFDSMSWSDLREIESLAHQISDIAESAALDAATPGR